MLDLNQLYASDHLAGYTVQYDHSPLKKLINI